jgi:hypothetical protein
MYHPYFNHAGSKKAADGSFWYNTTEEFLSTVDCFDGSKLLTNSGSISSANSGRPDGLFYDEIITSDITDPRAQAIAETPTQLEPNYWANKAVAGILRNFDVEGIPSLMVKERGVVEALSTRNASNTIFTIGDAVVGVSIGDFFIAINQDNEIRSYGYVRSIDGGNKRVGLTTTYSRAIDGDSTDVWSRTNGDIYTILKVEYSTSETADLTWTDIIGDPANYPRQATGVIDWDTYGS